MPNAVVQEVRARSLPDWSPAHGKTAIDGKPTAYVCIGPVLLPVTDAAALTEADWRRSRAKVAFHLRPVKPTHSKYVGVTGGQVLRLSFLISLRGHLPYSGGWACLQS